MKLWLHQSIQGLFQGIKVAIDLGLTALIVDLDSVNVVSLINGGLSSRKEIGWLVSEIKGLLTDKTPFMVKHVPRSCNIMAHNLAKLTFSFPEGYI